tara:strand:+ start:357 stop:569 length:213 start_codon:yes stop_codon:yes gene_type:complete
MKKIFFALIFLYIWNLNSQTDLKYYFNNPEKFNQKIPKQSEIIGHEVREWHVTHDKLVHYMYAIYLSNKM